MRFQYFVDASGLAEIVIDRETSDVIPGAGVRRRAVAPCLVRA